VKKYVLLLAYSFQKSACQVKELLFRALFLGGILFIFSKLWKLAAIEDQGMMIWYLAMTETIFLSVPLIYLDIESDIRSGDLACHLCKPMHYIGSKFAEHAGIYLFRFLILSIFSIYAAIFFSGGIVPDFKDLISSLIACCFAGLGLLLFHASIGLTAIRLQDCTPLCWIWQRAAFLLGGLVMPISLYPEGVQSLIEYLPFAVLLYKPASLVLGNASLLSAIGGILLWSLVAISIALWLYRKAMNHLTINGG
jgi:ABC-2 type transport system permease protein